MLTTYPTREAFAAALDERLSGPIPDSAVREAVVAGILAGDDELRAAPRAGTDLSLRVGGWFLRTEDVPFVESMGAAGALAASLATGAAVPAVIAAVSSGATIAWRIWRRGGRLTRRQLLVITLLREHGPADRDKLATLLNEQGQPVSAAELGDLLFDLQHVELADGSVVPLVRTVGEHYAAAKV